jgi:hypothetical protein
VYINGQVDTAEVERIVHESDLADHVFLFRCSDEPDERLERRLMVLFSVKRRAAVLTWFERDLDAFLNESCAGSHATCRCLQRAAMTWSHMGGTSCPAWEPSAQALFFQTLDASALQ